jgi:hypothetical protein
MTQDNYREEIAREHRNGATKMALADKYGCTADTIRQRCREQDFIEDNPDLAATMTSHELAAAAFLWAKGFVVLPRDDG